ncbi:hypothetical protein ACFL0T_08420, partial [Candidatus Omnitrophota bacterium]
FGAAAGNPSDPKVPYGQGLANLQEQGIGPVNFSFDYNFIVDRDLDGATLTEGEELEGQWYLFRLGYNINEYIEPYLSMGLSNLNASFNQYGNFVKVNAANAFAIGGGGKIMLFEIPESNIRISGDAHYLYSDSSVDKVKINSVNNPNISITDFKIHEWQISAMLSREFFINYSNWHTRDVFSFLPYLGVGYIDSSTKTEFNLNGLEYELDAGNDKKVVFLTGLNVTSPDNISINVEGRWFGETAGSGGITLKF